MASYLGVDWAGGCWLVVKTGDETLVTTEPSIHNVWHEHGKDGNVESILVDIPIGLPDDDSRECDAEAKECLKDRRSTVFSVPKRDVVEIEDYPDARKENDGSLGSQSWWLFPRIKEVDVFLQECEGALAKTYESHPEVCFAKLAGGALSGKDSDKGRAERRDILAGKVEFPDEISKHLDHPETIEWHHRISKGRLDDVLDAAVLAYTAQQLALGPRDRGGEYPAFRCRDDQRDDKLEIIPEIVHPGPD